MMKNNLYTDCNIYEKCKTIKDIFLTKRSKDIKIETLLKICGILDRKDAIIKIDDVLKDIDKSILVETGVLEYSLVYAFNNNISENIIKSIYDDVVENILINIDPKSKIKNNNLRNNIINNYINPQYVAFLSPDQMNPEIWKDIINKKQYEIDKEKNKSTSNAYTCYKCGEKKCRITQLQTRSADEPMTSFITCQVCYNTFVK